MTFIDEKMKEFDEKVGHAISQSIDPEGGFLTIEWDVKRVELKEFLSSVIKEGIEAYDRALCLKHNCREMDRIEQYYAGFKKMGKISDTRTQALLYFGVKEKEDENKS